MSYFLLIITESLPYLHQEKPVPAIFEFKVQLSVSGDVSRETKDKSTACSDLFSARLRSRREFYVVWELVLTYF